MKTWGHLSEKVNIADCQELIGPYMLFLQTEKIFKPLCSSEDGIAPAKQSMTLRGIGLLENTMIDCDETVWNRSASFAKALRAITTTLFEEVQILLEQTVLYMSLPDKRWGYWEKYVPEEDCLPELFSTLPQFVIEATNLGHEMATGFCEEIALPHSGDNPSSTLPSLEATPVLVTGSTAQPVALSFKVATGAPLEALRETRKR